MRVVAGKYKGRRLDNPIGYDIRPTSDKVKESIFNILMNDTYGRVFCDLFSGTGSLGIEALSRGAKKCYFSDYSRESIRLILDNIKNCNCQKEAIVLQGDYNKNLARISEKIDVFLLDPPYKSGFYEKSIEEIENLDLLAQDGIILAEHEVHDIMPRQVGNLHIVKEKKYGKIMVSLYKYNFDKEIEE